MIYLKCEVDSTFSISTISIIIRKVREKGYHLTIVDDEDFISSIMADRCYMVVLVVLGKITWLITLLNF